MRIVSWNVNGLRANAKKGGFDWLINQDADIFCLQETKAHPDQLELGILNPTGYFSYFDHSKIKKGYSGVAVYTKIKPDKVEYGLGIDKLDQEGRFLGLFFNGKPNLALFNVYFPNGGGGPDRLKFKLAYYEAFLKHINQIRSGQPNVIFCGDVNTAHNEIDLARPKENEENTGFLPIERAWLDKVVDSGYSDTFRVLHPDKKDAYTYWDMKTFARERNVGWRIDYFFASKQLMPKIKKSEIHDTVFGSDHCPISLEVE